MLRGTLIFAIVIGGFAATKATTAQAATLNAGDGAAFVNTGTGFKATTGSVVLDEGARVLVSPGKTAVISYNASCSVRIGSGRVWTIAAKAPCAPGHQTIDFTTRMNATEGEQQTPPEWDPALGESPPTETPQGPGIGTSLLIGGVVIGGIIGVIAAVNSDDKKDSPASP